MLKAKNVIQETFYFQRLKVKKLLKIWKPVVESKKLAEKSENSWKQKSCWKIFKPTVESKKVTKKYENQRLKAKTLFKKNYISFVEMWTENFDLAVGQIVNLKKRCISYSELCRLISTAPAEFFFSKVYIIQKNFL